MSPSSQASRTSKGQSQNRVLIVEDELLIAENLRYVLEDKGYEVVGIAASGEEAVFQAGAKSPDLILMDIRISGEFDGIEAAKRIRSSQRQDLPIIFISAYSSEKFPHLKDLEVGSFSYVQKPYSPRDLIAMLHSLLTRH